MTLITAGKALESALAGLTADGSLSVSVRELPAEQAVSGGTPYQLSVHGGDRPGIVSRVVGEVALGRRQHHRAVSV